MAEWLARRTRNPVVPASSRSDHYLDLFHGSPKFRSSAMLVNSQLVCLRLVVQFELFVSVFCSAPLCYKHCQG